MEAPTTTPRSLPSKRCKVCGKVFHKGEHLRRHERTHTGFRPFRCQLCGKTFSRQDSLSRHQRLHGTSGRPQNPSPPLSSSATSPDTPGFSPNTETSGPWTSNIIGADSHDDYGIFNGQPDHFPSSETLPPMDYSNTNQPLIWSDTEGLSNDVLEWFANSGDQAGIWNMPKITPSHPSETFHFTGDSAEAPTSLSDRTNPIGAIPSGGNQYAISGVSNMVTGLSSDVTKAAGASCITSGFLDVCLHLFFLKFNPTFPVLHRATFVFSDTMSPLLLNAIAIGSLYSSDRGAVATGEALWRLAHVAVTTSHEELIGHRGPYDTCKGTQLVITALLGQIYGALSKNRAIRSTCQAFHSVGCSWATQCGLFGCDAYSPESSALTELSDEELDNQWRNWVAREIQQRVLVGHYIVDGLITQLSQGFSTIWYTKDQLQLIGNEGAFEASTAREWAFEMSRAQNTFSNTFGNTFSFYFSPGTIRSLGNYASCSFSVRALLEGFQSLVLQRSVNDSGGFGTLGNLGTLGTLTMVDIRAALARVFSDISNNDHLPLEEKQEIKLRWHGICLETYINSADLCKHLCSKYAVEQHVWTGKSKTNLNLDIQEFVSSSNGRRALLHALAIQEIIEKLPRGRAHVLHMPICLFATATIYTAFAIAGSTTVDSPKEINWSETLYSDIDPSLHSPELANGSNSSETHDFILGQRLSSPSHSTWKNLYYEMNTLQKLFHCMFSQWGIAHDMENVVDQWKSVISGS